MVRMAGQNGECAVELLGQRQSQFVRHLPGCQANHGRRQVQTCPLSLDVGWIELQQVAGQSAEKDDRSFLTGFIEGDAGLAENLRQPHHRKDRRVDHVPQEIARADRAVPGRPDLAAPGPAPRAGTWT